MFGASTDNLRELLGKHSPFATVTLQQLLLCWTLWEFNVKTQEFYFPLIVRFLIIIVVIIIILAIIIVIDVKNVTQNFILLLF